MGQSSSEKTLAEQLGLSGAQRLDLVPGKSIPAVRVHPQTGQRELTLLQWGLIPSGAKSKAIAPQRVFARAETLAEKPAFAEAFAQRRCLIPTEGFFQPKRSGGKRQQYYLHRTDGHLIAFGGIWEHWHRAGETIESCALITVEANRLIQRLNDRMPLIVPPEHYQMWLDPETPVEQLQQMLVPFPADLMQADEVKGRRGKSGPLLFEGTGGEEGP